MTDPSFTLRRGEALRARLVAIVRNHHDTMPGGERDRPGLDRLRVEVPGGEEQIVDVWSTGRQDVATAGAWIEIFENDGLLCWQSVPVASLAVPPANDARTGDDAATPSDLIGAHRPKAISG